MEPDKHLDSDQYLEPDQYMEPRNITDVKAERHSDVTEDKIRAD